MAIMSGGRCSAYEAQRIGFWVDVQKPARWPVGSEQGVRSRLGHSMALASLAMSAVSVAIFLFLAEFRSLADGLSAARAPLVTTSLILGVGALPVAIAAALASRGWTGTTALAVACVHLALHVVVG